MKYLRSHEYLAHTHTNPDFTTNNIQFIKFIEKQWVAGLND